ncbi:type II toxin-antitoxin system RelE family toxin [Desulfosarcina variabilis]|uniref:type II toxin-antitoxin system RelE family toxin n=1 Tax=Desulfosarcina variabilis TaxID=2300 RepID=UPI003AFB0903
MKTIKWNNKARKQIKKIPKHYQEAIFDSVDKLEDFPKCTNLDIVPLKNHQYDYRLRVGRYRVLFDDKKEVQIIAIQEVKKRNERTY